MRYVRLGFAVGGVYKWKHAILVFNTPRQVSFGSFYHQPISTPTHKKSNNPDANTHTSTKTSIATHIYSLLHLLPGEFASGQPRRLVLYFHLALPSHPHVGRAGNCSIFEPCFLQRPGGIFAPCDPYWGLSRELGGGADLLLVRTAAAAAAATGVERAHPRVGLVCSLPSWPWGSSILGRGGERED